MDQAVFMAPRHVLGPLYSGHEFSVLGYTATSIKMAFWIIMFVLHSRPDLANAISHCNGLLHDATGIASWVRHQDFLISADWVFSAESVCYAIMLHLINLGNNLFVEKLYELYQRCGDRLKFALTGRSRFPELVWSCGIHISSHKRTDFENPKHGFNLYGDIVGLVFSQWCRQIFDIHISISDLLDQSSGGQFRRTVLLLSDSESKQVFHIYNGHNVHKRGAVYHHLAELIDRRDIDATEYKYIIIVCGINISKKRDVRHWMNSWRPLRDRLDRVIYPGSPHRIILNGPLRNPKAKYSAEHTDWMKQQIDGIENLTFCDWSQPRDNPFVRRPARRRHHWEINPNMYYKDRYHVNHSGYRQFWIRWSSIFTELKTVTYHLAAFR